MGLFKSSRSKLATKVLQNAMEQFDKRISAIEVSEPAHRTKEITVLKSDRGGWQGRVVAFGTVTEVRETLRLNLERDADIAAFAEVLATSPSDHSFQLNVVLQNNRGFSNGNSYRIWSTPDGAALFCRSDSAALKRLRTTSAL